MIERILYIHCGFPKTGTSALQHALRNGLVPEIHYPQVGQWFDGAHHELVFAYSKQLKGETGQPVFDDLLHALRKDVAADSRDVLLSSEAIVTSDAPLGFVDAIVSATEGLFSQVKLILTFRRHISWLSSLYNQDVKDPSIGETCEPDHYLELNAVNGYLHLAQNLVGPYPIMPVIYEPRDTLLARLLQACGVNSLAPEANTEQNSSMSRNGLMEVLEINRTVRDLDERRRRVEEILALPDQFGGSHMPFSAEAIALAEPHFVTDRAALRALFTQVCSADTGSLFDGL